MQHWHRSHYCGQQSPRSSSGPLCPDSFSDSIAKLANNANVIVLGMRLIVEMLAREIVDTWLTTEPSTEERRMNFHSKTDELDQKYRKAH